MLELQADFNDEGNADNLNYQQLQELTELADYQEPQESEEDMPIVDVDSSEDEEVEEQQPVTSAIQIPMAPPPLPDQRPQSTPNDLSEPEPRERVDPGKYPLPNRFKFAMGMLIKKLGMSRSDYKMLRGVLRMLEVPEGSTSDINVYRAKMRELLSLPDSSDTLKHHVDRQMPMIELRRQEIALDSTQLPTLAAGDKDKDKEKKQYIHFSSSHLLQQSTACFSLSPWLEPYPEPSTPPQQLQSPGKWPLVYHLPCAASSLAAP